MHNQNQTQTNSKTNEPGCSNPDLPKAKAKFKPREAEKMDIRETVTNQIIALIEAGEVTGETLWDRSMQFGIPKNYKTKENYSGVNIPLLWGAAVDRGLKVNEWLTFKQAQELGGNVKKGAKGVLAVFYKMAEKHIADENGEDQLSKFGILKHFWLFNVADIDGLPEVPEEGIPDEKPEFTPIEKAENFLNAVGASITWSGTRAYYSPAGDYIQLPDRERFSKPENAYAVALHEVAHWTGHESRLNRDFKGRFGSESYAFEELIADLTAAFMVSDMKLENARIENHASYIKSWLKVLRNDKNAIFLASSQAQKAFNFLHEKTATLH